MTILPHSKRPGRGTAARICAFLPGTDHPSYRDVLRELVRVDLEFCWQSSERRTVADYARAFPHILNDAEIVEAIAFEEFRQRLRVGEKPVPSEYAERYRVNVAGWEEYLCCEGSYRAKDEGPSDEEFDDATDRTLRMRFRSFADSVSKVRKIRSRMSRTGHSQPSY